MDIGRLDRQLAPLGDMGKVLASIAGGAMRVLDEDYVFETLTSDIQFKAIAAMYGTLRRVCLEVIEDEKYEPASRDVARATYEAMGEIVILTDAPDPNPPKELTLLERLRQVGAVPITPGDLMSENTPGNITDRELDEALGRTAASDTPESPESDW